MRSTPSPNPSRQGEGNYGWRTFLIQQYCLPPLRPGVNDLGFAIPCFGFSMPLGLARRMPHHPHAVFPWWPERMVSILSTQARGFMSDPLSQLFVEQRGPTVIDFLRMHVRVVQVYAIVMWKSTFRLGQRVRFLFKCQLIASNASKQHKRGVPE